MKNLKRKLGGGAGFTLVEMLIVVAIIAILIAISIPLVNNALEKARHATDAANERAAKAQILIQNLSEEAGVAKTDGYYDAVSGTVVKEQTEALKGYGKHTDDHKDKIIQISYSTANGNIYMKWVAADDSKKTPAPFTASVKLCGSVAEPSATHTP